MKKNFVLHLFIIFSLGSVHAQSIGITYLDRNDSTTSYFVTIKPKDKIQAVVVFIPGLYQTPEELLLETEIDDLLAENGIMLVVPFLTKESLHFEKETRLFLKTVVESKQTLYPLCFLLNFPPMREQIREFPIVVDII